MAFGMLGLEFDSQYPHYWEFKSPYPDSIKIKGGIMVQAKVKCTKNESPEWDTNDSNRNVNFQCVYDSDPNSPNYEWSKYTPSGNIHLNVTNPNAFNKFVVGAEYIVSFEEV